MNRRQFLGASVAAAACGSLPAVGHASAEGAADQPAAVSKISDRLPGSHLPLSLAAYSFRKELSGKEPEMTLDDFVDFCARQGLDATELTSYYFRRTDAEYLCSLRRRAAVNGLAISGTPVGNDFCKAPGPEREAQIAHVKQWIDHVAVLGSQTIRVFAGRISKGVSEEQARAWCIEGLKEVAEYAGQRGILLGLENHGGITATVEQLLALVRGVDSPWLGVNLDTGNFHQRVYESLEAAAPWAVSCQVKVETREGRDPPQKTDFRRVATILRNAGYRGWVALEYEAREPACEAVPRYLEELRRALA